jgi:hypothetical protein
MQACKYFGDHKVDVIMNAIVIFVYMGGAL